VLDDSNTALLLQMDGENDVKKEALWCIGNAACSSDLAHIEHLVASNCLPPMVQNLGRMQPTIQMVMLMLVF
jgi:hypothetical protein